MTSTELREALRAAKIAYHLAKLHGGTLTDRAAAAKAECDRIDYHITRTAREG